LLRWYRELVAQKYDGSARHGSGRPRRRARGQATPIPRGHLRWSPSRRLTPRRVRVEHARRSSASRQALGPT
jgi:hypothetical protein